MPPCGLSVRWRGKREEEDKHGTKPLQYSIRNATVEEHTERGTEKVTFSEWGRSAVGEASKHQ